MTMTTNDDDDDKDDESAPSISLYGKTAGFLDGASEFVFEFVVGFVGRDVDAVETRVSLGQIVRRRVHQMDGEEARTVRTRRPLQSFESL